MAVHDPPSRLLGCLEPVTVIDASVQESYRNAERSCGTPALNHAGTLPHSRLMR